jgi:hypothetical protein
MITVFSGPEEIASLSITPTRRQQLAKQRRRNRTYVPSGDLAREEEMPQLFLFREA